MTAVTRVACAACLLCASFTGPGLPAACAQSVFTVSKTDLQKQANGVLSLMGYMLTPDVTTGSLAITDASTGNPGLSMTSLGGGFTVSRDFPLYLEGTAAYARYDPTFVARDRIAQRRCDRRARLRRTGQHGGRLRGQGRGLMSYPNFS